MATGRLRWAIEPLGVETLHPSKESSHLAGPRHRRELVHGGDDKAGQPSVDWLVDPEDRQPSSAAEVAGAIHTPNPQILRGVGIRLKIEGMLAELCATPRAFLQRDRSGFA